MPAAIPLIVMGVSAAAGAYGAKKSADAAKQASQVQVQASDKAMDYQRQATQEARAYAEGLRTAPLQPLQGSAANSLQYRMGVPSGYGGLMGGSPVNYQMPQQQPQSGGYRALLGSQDIRPAPPMGSAASGGGVVLLQAPTGEQKAVPAEQAQAYIARGARRVN